jgi:hypothetical protein
MGDLILFRPSRNAARLSSAPAQPQDAHILFFTGVRYKREIEAVAPEISVEHGAPPKGGIDGAGGRRRKRRG